jgi:hypothetical protein
MLSDIVFKNHSQLEDERLESTSTGKQEAFEKRIGRNKNNLLGIETKLGHVFSVYLDLASNTGLVKEGFKNELAQFLGYIKERLERRGDYIESQHIDLNSRTFGDREAQFIYGYITNRGLDAESCKKVMKEIFGSELPIYF